MPPELHYTRLQTHVEPNRSKSIGLNIQLKAKYTLFNKAVGQAVCKPTNKELLKQVEPAIVVGYAYSAMHNIQLAGPIILASAGITFTLALVFTCLLTYLTTCVTWIFLVVYLLLTAVSGALCFMKAVHMLIPYPLNIYMLDFYLNQMKIRLRAKTNL